MVEELRNLAARVQGFRKVLWPDRKKQVQGQAPRGQARALVDAYFRDVRDKLRLGGISDETLSVLDGEMHELLELAARRSAGVRYISVLDAVLENLRRLEHVALEVSAGSSSDSALAGVDERIVETLATMVPSAARSYEQALIDLAGPDRLSWRGPATDLREALRETLDHLAPDEDVVGGPGFKLEKDTSGPTMKQKVRYVLSKRGLSKSASAAPEAAARAVEDLVGMYVRSVYGRSNVSTHTPTEREEVVRVRDYVRVALCELLSVGDGA